MSEIKVDKISPQSGTALAVGDSGDTITIPSGATITNSGTANGFGSDTLLQKKWYYFAEGSSQTSAGAWADMVHPIGDGTLAITPAATGNIIQIDFLFFLGHASIVHSGNIRVIYASGGSYGAALGLGNDNGFGTFGNFTTSMVSSAMGGTLWVAAANTNAHTFKFQWWGWASAGTVHLNYLEGNTGFPNGTANSIVAISEYDATSSAITAGGAL
jgi:hypothetical protein